MRRSFTQLLLLLLTVASVGLSAQSAANPGVSFLQKNFHELDLTAADVDNLEVTDDYASPNGTRHIYVSQRVHGLPILNAQAALHFNGSKLIYRTSNLATGLADLTSPAPAFSAQTAVSKAANNVTAAFGNPTIIGMDEDGTQRFEWAELSPKPINVSTGYYRTEAGLRLAYQVQIDRHAADADYWQLTIDAETGDVLDKLNFVLKCDFGTADHSHRAACAEKTGSDLPVGQQIMNTTMSMMEESSYNVFPFGEESPIHGERVIEVSPAHPVASPFGWHDVNGADGAEFTTTRGNNTWSYPDRDGNNNVDTDVVVDGGDSLVFNEAYAEDVSADSLIRGALVQTFYFNNKLHDWLYMAGFDEVSGNFQSNNYGNGGRGGDPVRVEAQDGSGTNNANFGTPPDGQSGTMQMFLWTGSNSALTVNNGGDIEGGYTTGTTVDWGADITDVALTGQVKIVDPALACTEVTNTDEMAGNVALVTRGECNFSLKAFNAQEAGAIAVIICNDAREGEDRGGIINMSNGNPELEVTIPAVFITFESCVGLRNTVASGDSVSVSFRTPPPIDGDFDNGIVAHELGHGVSNRLIGGPSRAGCLGNDEQMGEGWSDFFSLASSPKTILENPDGTEPRGIGNYATRRGINGRGIRSRPYSTDFAVNEQTYYNVIISGTAPHPLGEIWAATLWDLYWKMVDTYGFDDDLIDGTGGNNLAVELVIEGMKFTNCEPGLVDGRDGILAADEAMNDGANSCAIWEVFARRGIGFSADQGSSDDRTDNRSAFDISPYCIGEIQLTKSVDEATVNAGEGVTVSLRAESFREGTPSKTTITDEIPAGMTLDPASIRGTENFTIDGNVITFDIGDLEFEGVTTVTYSMTTNPDVGSMVTFFDGAEEDDSNFEIDVITTNPDFADLFWEQTDVTPFDGELAWFVPNDVNAQDQELRTAEPFTVTGENPAIRFQTKYNTEAGWDGGVVEISTNGNTWDRVGNDLLIRGEYRGVIAPNSNSVLANAPSFWGDSEDYSDIVIDLSRYAGQDIFVRWRFVSDAADAADGTAGWWVDDIQFLNLVSYDAPATLTSNNGDNTTANIGNLGVLAMMGTVNTDDPVLGQTDVNVFPNPADDFVTVEINAERAGKATVQLLSIDGRALRTEALELIPGTSRTTLSTAQLPAGVYVVQVTGANRVSTTKLTVN